MVIPTRIDEEETGLIPVVKGGRNCPRGMIRRKASVRSKSTCVKDLGARGRWQTVRGTKGIGSLKEGELKSLGYSHTLTASQRHTAIDKAVKKYGRNSTIRKLNAIATYTKRTAPSRSKTYKTDQHYVQKKY